MDGYNLLRKISVVGLVFSIIVVALSSILFWWELRNPKNLHKLLGELSLEMYLNVKIIGIILAAAFVIILVLGP